jgi:hypothetical protein
LAAFCEDKRVLSVDCLSKRLQDQSSPFRVAFLALTLLIGYQIILICFPFRCDVALARQVAELANQLVRFDVNPEPPNPEPVNGYKLFLYHLAHFVSKYDANIF